MKVENFTFGLLLIFFICSCSNSSTNSLEKFRGMWRLDKYEAFDSTTRKWHDAPKRIGYSGYILYDGVGHMGVELFPPGFERLDESKSIDSIGVDKLKEMAIIQSKSFVYFGNCTISDEQNLIEHHIQSSNHPNEIGTTVKRNFEFNPDTLILTANELIGGSKTRLRWIKYSK